MGVLTNITEDYDDEEQVQRIFAVTRFGIDGRTQLNRVASRAALMTGVGQRTLVVAAHKKEDVNLPLVDGSMSLFGEDNRPPDAYYDINYYSKEIESASKIGDVLPQQLQDFIQKGKVGRGSVLHVWEIPYKYTSE